MIATWVEVGRKLVVKYPGKQMNPKSAVKRRFWAVHNHLGIPLEQPVTCLRYKRILKREVFQVRNDFQRRKTLVVGLNGSHVLDG